MTFNRADYERLVDLARKLYASDNGDSCDAIAKELFDMAEKVIGQQSPPLIEQGEGYP